MSHLLTCTAARQKGAINTILLHCKGSVVSSIFMYSLWLNLVNWCKTIISIVTPLFIELVFLLR